VSYDKFSPEEKAVIARATIDNGVTRTINKYNKDLHERKLKESTVWTWVTEYKRELQLRKESGIHLTSAITALNCKRQGRPMLIGEELDSYTRDYIRELRRNGGIVNADIVSSAAIGIFKKHDSNLLQCNGGHIVCNQEWAKNFLRRLGYVKRRANTKSKVTVEHFEMYNLFTTLK
jgi:hypothetical protein